MNDPFQKRLRHLCALLVQKGMDALLVRQRADWYYLTGFTGEAGVLVVGLKGATLVTDGRLTTQAREEMRGVGVRLQKGSVDESVGRFLRSARLRRIGYDAGSVTVAEFRALRRCAGPGRFWKPVTGLVKDLRSRKEAAEIGSIRAAGLLAGEVLEGVLKLLKPGVREFEVAAEIEYQMRRRGASGPAFETIVAFGERSALPHACPTARKLGEKELVVLDLGAILGHYCSDITRTVFIGRAPGRVRQWYKAVREAQAAAIQSVRAGVSCGEVDAAARRVLAGYRLNRYFVHSTGHGIGLEVHEEPRVAKGRTQRLEAGHVVTIEPGVYVSGIGGIRIEDDVAVQANGSEVLTRIPRDFIEL